jgi:rhodanese-related sulfurtransferase
MSDATDTQISGPWPAAAGTSDWVDAPGLREMLADPDEIALLDVRDGGPYAREHLLLASSVPLAQIEVRMPVLVPRRSTRIVLCDDAGDVDSEADRAARLLRAFGYGRVLRLAGGVKAWKAAGYEVFSGTNVPSKAFGEFIEHLHDTPRIDPLDLRRWVDEGRDVLVIDSRPLEEFRMVSIPGASNCPGAELALRVPALVRSEHTTVVINCAGRTRSIIGAQSLRNAGLSNPVYALRNGTMGWHLAGLKTDHGQERSVPMPTPQSMAQSRERARRLALKHGVRFIDAAQLAQWQAQPSRTTYVFDVRQASAFAGGHLAGSLHAPGGQLVQATDTFAAVRKARIVLVDEHGVQAPMTGHWLRQMGWSEVFVLEGFESLAKVQGDPAPAALGADRLQDPGIDPLALAGFMGQSPVCVIDVGDSFGWRRERIPGSRYAMRSRLPEALHGLSVETDLVFVCADGRLSPFAARDARDAGWSRATWLQGGRAGWRRAGQAMDAGEIGDDPLQLTPTDDMWYPPWARADQVEQAMREYLTWEVDLLEQLAREPYLKFESDIDSNIDPDGACPA